WHREIVDRWKAAGVRMEDEAPTDQLPQTLAGHSSGSTAGRTPAAGHLIGPTGRPATSPTRLP
ncbi:hypothetical protein, partial [Streptosporangium minutum]